MENNFVMTDDLFKKIDKFQLEYILTYGKLPSEEEVVELVKSAKKELIDNED